LPPSGSRSASAKTRVLDSWAILEWISGRRPAGDIWSVATLKARFPIAYAGASAPALAKKHDCPLVTGDLEFRRVDRLALDWIGGGHDLPPAS
jgi:hypothetical protein